MNLGTPGPGRQTASLLLQPTTVDLIERAVSVHLGRPWTTSGFIDVADRSSHPAGVFHGASLSVFAKLGGREDSGRQFAAELAGLKLISELAGVATAKPIGRGLITTATAAILLLEAVPERVGNARTGQDWRSIGRTLAVVHLARGDQYGLAQFDGFLGRSRRITAR